MEILLVLLVVCGALYWAYRQINKADQPQMNEPHAGTPTLPPMPAAEPAPVIAEVKTVLDVNQDGRVDLADAKAAVKKTRARVKKAADQDGDGRVTVKDIKVAASKARSAATKTMAKTRTPRAKK